MFPRLFPSWSRTLLAVFFVFGLAAANTSAENSAATTANFRRGISVGHWLAKMHDGQPYGSSWFGQDDVRWIAKQGFDHIRLPVDGRLWAAPDGGLDETKIAAFAQAMTWARESGLSVVLDMHFLPGGKFDADSQDTAIFLDPKAREVAAQFWKAVAKRFQNEGDDLRFDLVNEPFAPENRQLNQLNRELIAAIRSIDHRRVLYITSNQSSSFTTIGDLEVPNDPRVAITLHYDEPLIFTHQRAPWKHFPADMPVITFPGIVPDLSHALPAGHFAAKESGAELNVAQIDADFDRANAWARRAAPGKELQLGEFGVYEMAPADSRRVYIAAVRAAAERNGWGWTIWDYRSSFAVRNADGTPTPVLKGLFP